VEEGFLPVFSVDTEEEARELLVFACGTNIEGEFVARELVQEQTLEALTAFSDRLAAYWELLQANKAGQKGERR
jgi:hypothetical protein